MKTFPIMGFWNRRLWKNITGFTIPWEMIVSHEKQALLNHCGQTLQRLSERGGLDSTEAIAVLEDRDWQKMDEEIAMMKLKKMVFEYEQRTNN